MNIGNRYSSWLQNTAQTDYRNRPAKNGRERAAFLGDKKNDTSVTDNPDGKKEKTGTENTENMTYREQILAHMEQMAKKVKDGTVEPSFQIGAQSFTMREWEKLITNFDDAEEGLREQIKEMIAEVEVQAEKEALRRQIESGTADPGEVTAVSVPAAALAQTETAGSVTEPAADSVAAPAAVSAADLAAASQKAGAAAPETGHAAVSASAAEPVADEEKAPGAGSVSEAEKEELEQRLPLLTDEVTKCSYPGDSPERKHWFITCYGQDGISCVESYYDGEKWVNKRCWDLSYTEEGQYEKVMAFLKRFPQDANLRFASHENFWKDFLAGEIDEDDFVNFFETSTKDGVPDYTYEKDGSTYIDREKIKYAKYMNGFGAHFYTAEEMELIQRAVIKENSKRLKKISSYDGQMTVPGGGKEDGAEDGEDSEDDLKTRIITKPDGSAVLQIETNFGVMEVEITEAQKFGLQYEARPGAGPDGERAAASPVDMTGAGADVE